MNNPREEIREAHIPQLRHFRRFLITCVLAMLFVFSPAVSQAANQSYSVSYAGVPVVNVTIHTETDGKAWYGEYHAWVKRGLGLFYSVDNTYRIIAIPQSWLPVRYTKTVREGEEVYSQQYSYYPERNTVLFPGGTTASVPDSLYNLFSAMLWVQHHEWTVGETRTFPVDVDGQIWQVQADAASRDTGEYRGDKISLIQIRVTFLRKEGTDMFEGKKDILSSQLPHPGRKILFWIDTSEQAIHQIQVPMNPFSLWARRK